ncbi:MAG TPA: hypothetical protein VGH47_00695 [Xanthobacteraceae bacterium]|jgi:hypothetical protein
MTDDLKQADEQRQALMEMANAGAQPNQPTPGGHALVRPTQGIAERVIGAQPVAVYRDEAKILQKLSALAAAAGSDWFYRFPVRTKDGGQDWIEGPSIKLANDVARIFGNNSNEVREIDVGDAWIFYARFTDIETGFSMERAYRQRKSQTSMKTKDADRQLDIAYQIGQSKAIRNCIVNALQIYADYAYDQARNSLVEKIGKDLEAWRVRAIEGLARMPVELSRAERVIGRARKDWLAPDIARLVAMMRAVADGMATVEDTFPAVEKAAEVSTKPADPTSAGAGESATKAETKTEQPAAAPTAFAPTAPKNFAQYKEYLHATCDATEDPEALRAWFSSDAQRRLRNAIGLIAEETADAKKIVDARIKELK